MYKILVLQKPLAAFLFFASRKEVARGEDLELPGLDQVDRCFVEECGHLLAGDSFKFQHCQFHGRVFADKFEANKA